jgi:hypothetical protein
MLLIEHPTAPGSSEREGGAVMILHSWYGKGYKNSIQPHPKCEYQVVQWKAGWIIGEYGPSSCEAEPLYCLGWWVRVRHGRREVLA